jgi:hypothetical protein
MNTDLPAKLIPASDPQNGEFVCIGACGELLPLNKFPTPSGVPGGQVRIAECRSCRDRREAGKGGNGALPPWKP